MGVGVIVGVGLDAGVNVGAVVGVGMMVVTGPGVGVNEEGRRVSTQGQVVPRMREQQE